MNSVKLFFIGVKRIITLTNFTPTEYVGIKKREKDRGYFINEFKEPAGRV